MEAIMSGVPRSDLLFITDRFNLSRSREYFINDCCYGDDVARWFVEQLRARGLTVTEPNQEDWGWYFDAEFAGAAYFVGVGGNSDHETSRPNLGEWRLMVEKHRTLWEKLTGANQLDEHDSLVALLQEILSSEPSLQFTGIE
jgi:hypothetical protein